MRFLGLLLVCVMACVMLASAATLRMSTGVRARMERARLANQTPRLTPSPFDAFPHMSVMDFAEVGALPGDDPLSQVRAVIGDDESFNALQAVASASSFVETGVEVGKVRSFCEICILVMQMKQRGQPHLCAGLNANYHITCIEVLESLLRADKAIVYWLKNGCMHMDSEGPEIVRPCPAINICSWVPNLFAEAPSLTRDGVESLCPKDPKFLPTIPQEFRNLLGEADSGAAAAGGATEQGPVSVTSAAASS